MSKVNINFACSPYDRTRALLDGTVVPEGIDLNFLPMEVEETFYRQFRYSEFEASEVSLSSYTLSRAHGDNRFIAIPVFTSRFFRHSCIYININSGIKTPEDLKGKIVGVPEYQMTSALWLRGTFQHEYGIKPSDIHWRTGGMEQPGRIEKIKIKLPSDVDCQPIPVDKTLAQMLETGEIDAVINARIPSTFYNGHNVKRLFENYHEVEAEYFRKTGIFPIMHCIAIRHDVYYANPWVAMSLFKALKEAKNIVMANFKNTSALYATLPWMVYEVERTKAIMGEDFWPYGIEPNRKALESICQYSYEQGLSEKLMTVEELFAKETFEVFKI
ncbi:4,5-dihydroxyphthalate decarboxylase [Desulfocucumis palustris]|uniref:4,5-dihydroxyphthalate decarboxylase n=1 Tax=Desulfocucumis palustris TaxID=1898651 RepID=A0A2L2X928_9FIRM|nr:ABC transporter substrate-binding protein [Desulfocucumis palustris]GBF32530.1 4,5-dihydroxyphthalate decarboxylase [Desulfocucumis palustris]